MSKEIEQRQTDSIQMALLKVCQNPDIDPDRLEKFLDLQIKMEERQAKAMLNKALCEFQAECPIIPRTKKAHNNNYAPYDEIKHIVKPIAKRFGLSWSFSINDKSDLKKEIEVTVRHIAGASFVSRYSFPSMDDGGKMNSSQRTRSSNSYAKRTALENALDIATQEMDDDARRAIDTPATQDELDQIKDLMRQTNANDDHLKAFLKVDSLDQLSKLEAKKAITALKRKRAAS